MKIVVLERNSVGCDVSIDALLALGETVVYGGTEPEEVAERIRDAEIVVANKAPLTAETLRTAPKVKLICEFATGFDNVDIAYCKANGIKVTNVRDYSTDAVAQHTLALCLYVLEKLSYYDRYVKTGAYSAQSNFTNFDKPFTELAGKTWGIIGMGNIGRKVAYIAEAFGCRVIFHSVTGKSSCREYEQVSFDTLLAESDILSLHCPLSDITRNLIDLTALKKMKKTAILLNLARGPVVNDEALYTALSENWIAAAGLDVLGKEPLEEQNPLSRIKDSERLIITPHIGWASVEARNRCVTEACLNIEAFLKGEDRNLVS